MASQQVKLLKENVGIERASCYTSSSTRFVNNGSLSTTFVKRKKKCNLILGLEQKLASGLRYSFPYMKNIEHQQQATSSTSDNFYGRV
jgi:hypothetical protein